MYVEFMKNFLLADPSELLPVRLILASWAQKRLIPTFYTWCSSSSWTIFFSPIRASWWQLESFRPLELKNGWFLLSRHDVRWVHEKFFSRPFERADGNWSHFSLLSPKTFDSYFLEWCSSSSWKIFFSPIRASYWLLDSFCHLEPKNVWFLLSRHCVRRVHEKFSSRPFQRTDGS